MTISLSSPLPLATIFQVPRGALSGAGRWLAGWLARMRTLHAQSAHSAHSSIVHVPCPTSSGRISERIASSCCEISRPSPSRRVFNSAPPATAAAAACLPLIKGVERATAAAAACSPLIKGSAAQLEVPRSTVPSNTPPTLFPRPPPLPPASLPPPPPPSTAATAAAAAAALAATASEM